MKQLITAILFTFSIGLAAQISVTSSDMPSPGDTIRTSISINSNGYDFSRTGSDFTWNFDGLETISQTVDTFLSITQTPVSFWPFFITSANLATRQNASNILPGLPAVETYRFYNNTNGSFKDAGYGVILSGVPIPLKYANADMIYTFPMNMGTTHESSSGLELSIPDMGYIMIDRNRSSVVDGWGNLTTPYGTFEVLRLKSTVSEYDSIYIDSLQLGLPLQRNYIEYQWIGKNFGTPLLGVTEDELFGTTIVFIDSVRGINVGIPEKILAKSFTVYPNPIQDVLKFQLKLASDCNLSISFYDMTGKCVYRSENQKYYLNSGEFVLPLSELYLQKGLYLIVVNAKDQVYTSKFIKD